jgi:pimeloyl-ACP methyl ester carboxylesterase
MKTQPVFKTPEGREILLQCYDELLAGWPLPLEKHEVETSYGRTFVLTWGDPRNPPLVVLHGSMSNSAMWIGEAVLYAKHFRVFAVDIPGEPGRSEPNRLNLSSPEPEQWLKEVLDGEGIDTVQMAGISMGGLFALRFAAAFPARIKRLILLCPAGVTSQRISFLWKAIKLVIFGSNGSEGATRLVFGNANVPEETITYTRLISTHFTPVLSVPNIPDAILARVKASTLVIAGDQDVLLDSTKSIKRLEKLLPDVQTVLIPGVGHVIVDQAARVIAFLLE